MSLKNPRLSSIFFLTSVAGRLRAIFVSNLLLKFPERKKHNKKNLLWKNQGRGYSRNYFIVEMTVSVV